MCRIHRQANYLGQVVKLDECSRSIKNIHSSLVSIVVIATLSPNLWHSRLSHASLSRLQLLASQTLFGLFFFITQFPSLNFCHSSLITHHFKYYTRLAPSLNIFLTISGLIPVSQCNFFFSFFFFCFCFQYPNSPKLKIKIKNKKKTQEKKGKKKSQKWSKVIKSCDWYCLIIILSLSYELWKLKTTKMYFQFS